MNSIKIILLSGALALSIGSAAQAATYLQNDGSDAYSATVYSGRSAFVSPDARPTRPVFRTPQSELCGFDIATECSQ